jgi:hypothetical protein
LGWRPPARPRRTNDQDQFQYTDEMATVIHRDKVTASTSPIPLLES